MEGTMSDSIDEQTARHSDEDMALIGNLVVWHQMPRLSARSLIQINCPAWPVWDPFNIARIAEARRLDDTRDWYFPLITNRRNHNLGEVVAPERCWTWSGIWHESARHARIDRALSLPPMTYLRKDWCYVSFMPCNIIASAGGLLLMWTTVRGEVIPKRRSPRLNKDIADPDKAVLSTPEWSAALGSGNRVRWPPKNFTRLLVCNPLTKEYRRLPEVDDYPMNWYSRQIGCCHKLQALMEVDDKVSSYQVIVLLQSSVALYKSTSNTWTCARLQGGHPRGPRCNISRSSASASVAHVDGRIYLADIQNFPVREFQHPVDHNSEPIPCGYLRVFDANVEDGTWRDDHIYTLSKFFLPVTSSSTSYCDSKINRNVEIVGCMGDLYAVIPAMLLDVVTVGETQSQRWKEELYTVGLCPTDGLMQEIRHSSGLQDLKNQFLEMNPSEHNVECMPLVFYVLQLQNGAGVDRAVLRIKIPPIRSPEDLESCMTRRRSLHAKIDPLGPPRCSWFSCEARGSVIWVSFEDYLLSYDVVSGKSATHLIPLGNVEGSTNEVSRFAYRPSFHMKP